VKTRHWVIETGEADAPPAFRYVYLDEGKKVHGEEIADAGISYGSDGFLGIYNGHACGPIRKTEIEAAIDVIQNWLARMEVDAVRPS